jgi:hypothetical protein
MHVTVGRADTYREDVTGTCSDGSETRCRALATVTLRRSFIRA